MYTCYKFRNTARYGQTFDRNDYLQPSIQDVSCILEYAMFLSQKVCRPDACTHALRNRLFASFMLTGIHTCDHVKSFTACHVYKESNFLIRSTLESF